MKRQPWEPFEFQKCYCAAIATAVGAVAAAGTAAYSASSQSSAASKAQSSIDANSAAIYGSKIKPVKYVNNVPQQDYNSDIMGTTDLETALPALQGIAKATTLASQKDRDLITGGQSSANLTQEGTDINSLLKGNMAPDVVDSVNRQVAARSGGAFMPNGGDNQSASDDFARSIGKTSNDMMTEGMTYAPQWESLTDAFTYKPQQAATDALNALRGRSEAATTQLAEDQAVYTGQLNYNATVAGRDPGAAGSTADSLALGTLQSKDQQNELLALLGAAKGTAGLYNTIKPNATTGGSNAAPTSAGTGGIYTGYTTGGLGDQADPSSL